MRALVRSMRGMRGMVRTLPVHGEQGMACAHRSTACGRRRARTGPRRVGDGVRAPVHGERGMRGMARTLPVHGERGMARVHRSTACGPWRARTSPRRAGDAGDGAHTGSWSPGDVKTQQQQDRDLESQIQTRPRVLNAELNVDFITRPQEGLPRGLESAALVLIL